MHPIGGPQYTGTPRLGRIHQGREGVRQGTDSPHPDTEGLEKTNPGKGHLYGEEICRPILIWMNCCTQIILSRVGRGLI